eukprot:2488896-Amphidinium_carterae.1
MQGNRTYLRGGTLSRLDSPHQTVYDAELHAVCDAVTLLQANPGRIYCDNELVVMQASGQRLHGASTPAFSLAAQ